MKMDPTVLIYSVIGFIGCSTNGFAIFILFHLNSRLSTTNLLITNQCIIDFVTSLMSLCLFLDPNIMTRLPDSNSVAEFVCRFWSSKYIFWACTCSSTANLVVLTVDRYFAVMHAIKYNVIKERLSMKVLFLLIPWICGFMFLLLWFAAHTVKDGECIQSWPSVDYQKAFGLLTTVYLLIIPISAMLFVYINIFYALRYRVGDVSSTINANCEARRLNIIKTMVIVSVTYIVCWTPNQIAFVNFTLGGELDFHGAVYYITIAMSLVNICVNPIIYTFKYNDFRVGVRKTLPCLKSIFTPQEPTPPN
ncbi:QRFP-like peptide receptor [Anneissia japonica]|uniref:QRFP-like peptide receptor n=1 Tax=Anneissia japonica TaxID=1529436 RepID=UPI00142565CE|nr:QRFP-like peptide receptor [Anneissia japonica]